MWYVYILICNDGSYYTGISNDVLVRVDEHNKGLGAEYTKSRLPVDLIYIEELGSKGLARKREIEVKSYSIHNKERLIKRGTGKTLCVPRS